MPTLKFTIPGKPQAKQRHSTVAMTKCMQCGRGHRGQYRQCQACGGALGFVANVPFTPADTVMFENLVAVTCRQAMQQQGVEQFREGSLRVELAFCMPIAETRRCSKGHSLIERNGCKKLHENDSHTQRPDLDNMQKSTLDGLNTVAFADDAIIAEIVARKVWSLDPRTEVEISEL